MESTATKLLYTPSARLSSSAIQWGKNHESDGRCQYETTLPPGYALRDCGIFIHTTLGYIGASPDGLVFRNGDDHPTGIIEIKCPFSNHSKQNIKEPVRGDKNSFCHIDENTGLVKLKVGHDYYYQVQGQMAVVGVQWCDFVIWTLSFMHVERIHYNEAFWKDKCLPQLSSFYMYIVAPELVYPRHNSTSGSDLINYRLLC